MPTVRGLSAGFIEAYQTPGVAKMVTALKLFLESEIPVAYRQSFHYKWLITLCDQHKSSEKEDLPAFVYGMISDAYDELLKDMIAEKFK